LKNSHHSSSQGWWPWLKDHFASKHKLTVDDSESYYCGDAAGRPAGLRPWSGIALRGKGDFSDSDRKFASNAGIRCQDAPSPGLKKYLAPVDPFSRNAMWQTSQFLGRVVTPGAQEDFVHPSNRHSISCLADSTPPKRYFSGLMPRCLQWQALIQRRSFVPSHRTSAKSFLRRTGCIQRWQL